jgi:hypothetical protein
VIRIAARERRRRERERGRGREREREMLTLSILEDIAKKEETKGQLRCDKNSKIQPLKKALLCACADGFKREKERMG